MESKNQNQKVITPSSLLPNKAGQFFKSLFLGQVSEEFNERFGDRPYSLRYAKLYTFASYLSYALQVISVLFALSFAANLMTGLLPDLFGSAKMYIAIGLGLGLLLLLEVAKRYVVTDFIDSIFKSKAIAAGNTVNFGLGVLAGLLITFSIYSSVVGAKQFVELQTNKAVELTAKGQSQKDSLAQLHASEVSQIRTEISDIKKRNTWKGNVWISGKDKALLLQKEQLLAKALQTKDNDLQTVATQTQTAISENQVDSNDKALKMFCFSFACEGLTLLCLYFLASYIFKSGLELENRVQGGNETQTQKVENQNPQSKPIGFAVATNKRIIAGRNGKFVFRNQMKTESKNPIGFKIPKGNGNRNTTVVNNGSRNNDHRNTAVVNTAVVANKELGNGNRLCKHCGDAYTYKSHLQKYCTEECRIASWEKRTGKTFKKGQNKTKSFVPMLAFPMIDNLLPYLPIIAALLGVGVLVWVLFFLKKVWVKKPINMPALKIVLDYKEVIWKKQEGVENE